ncbi:hypothetical protein EYC84_002501 [Monilinia fructicola]|uniref:Uncharacterized protein n=1 Tax=Monilinia fructicola TaxID=38448 RepID=A0A5M9JN81_MONFR|nr:hypothetical protein EYC84_002501 [Monilinia fructicola]
MAKTRHIRSFPFSSPSFLIDLLLGHKLAVEELESSFITSDISTSNPKGFRTPTGCLSSPKKHSLSPLETTWHRSVLSITLQATDSLRFTYPPASYILQYQ